MPRGAARDICWNPGVADFLLKIGARPDVIAFIESIDDPKLQGKLANEVRKNLATTVDQLKAFVEGLPEARKPTDDEQRVYEFFDNTNRNFGHLKPRHAAEWVLVQLMKHRSKRVTFLRHGFPEVGYYYGDMTEHGTDDLSLTNSGQWNIIRGYVFEIWDWVNATHVNLASYDWREAMVASNEWHHQCELKGGIYEPQDEKLIAYRFPDGWKVVKIASQQDLNAEGHYMKHCVSSYGEAVAKGDTRIFSLRDTKNQPHVTIEVHFVPEGSLAYVAQIRGVANADPKPEYKRRLKQWFSSLQPRWIGSGEGSIFSEYTSFLKAKNVSDVDLMSALSNDLQAAEVYGLRATQDDADFTKTMKDTSWALFFDKKEAGWNIDARTRELASALGELAFRLQFDSRKFVYFGTGSRNPGGVLVKAWDDAGLEVNRRIEYAENSDHHPFDVFYGWDMTEPNESPYMDEYGDDWQEPYDRAVNEYGKREADGWRKFWLDSPVYFWELAIFEYLKRCIQQKRKPSIPKKFKFQVLRPEDESK